MLTVIVERKLNTTFISLPTSILILKRFTGNKPIGHAHKLLTKLHSKPEFAASNIHTTNGDIKPNTNPKINPVDQPYDTMFQSESVPDIDMSRYVKKGIVQHAKNGTGEEQLTEQAREIHRFIHMPKIQVKNEEKPVEEVYKVAPSNINWLFGESDEYLRNRPLIAGTLVVAEQTEVQTTEQKHIVVATASNNEPTLEVTSYLTSEKGNTFLAGVVTTVKIADTQEISGDNKKGQYAKIIIPPYRVDATLFVEHEKATQVVNTPKYREKLDDMREESEQFEPNVYTGIGITHDHLRAIEAVMDSQEEVVPKSTGTEVEDPGDDAAN